MKKRKDNLSNRINSLGTEIEKLSKTKKILIIDSNRNLCQPLQNYFIKHEHDCVCAIDGRNGLSLIEKEKFDLVLLDLKHADIIDKLKEIRIIVWSTLDLSQSEIDDLLKRGAYSYLKKPVMPEVLLRTIETIQPR